MARPARRTGQTQAQHTPRHHQTNTDDDDGGGDDDTDHSDRANVNHWSIHGSVVHRTKRNQNTTTTPPKRIFVQHCPQPQAGIIHRITPHSCAAPSGSDTAAYSRVGNPSGTHQPGSVPFQPLAATASASSSWWFPASVSFTTTTMGRPSRRDSKTEPAPGDKHNQTTRKLG